MKELKLLYSYEEWKTDKNKCFKPLSEDMAELMSLTMQWTRTEEDKIKIKELNQKTEEETNNQKYTSLVYEITDLFNKLKYVYDDNERKDIYEAMGRKQCEIEQLKELL